MNDKELMENLLLLEKGTCDLLMHGAIESSTANVHKAFSTALDDSICLQTEIYTKMAARGWYPPEQAEQTKVNAVKQRYGAQA